MPVTWKSSACVQLAITDEPHVRDSKLSRLSGLAGFLNLGVLIFHPRITALLERGRKPCNVAFMCGTPQGPWKIVGKSLSEGCSASRILLGFFFKGDCWNKGQLTPAKFNPQNCARVKRIEKVVEPAAVCRALFASCGADGCRCLDDIECFVSILPALHR